MHFQKILLVDCKESRVEEVELPATAVVMTVELVGLSAEDGVC